MLSTIFVILVLVIVICLFSNKQRGGNIPFNPYGCDYSRPVMCNADDNCQYNYSEMKCIDVSMEPRTTLFYNQKTGVREPGFRYSK